MNTKLRNLIFTGLLISIGIVLSQLLSFYFPPSTSIIKIGIGYLPLMIISILFGPQYGLIAGAIQDIIGYFMLGTSRGAFYFGFTFIAMLYGVLPWMIMKLQRKFSKQFFFVMNVCITAIAIIASIYFLFHIDIISSNVNFKTIYRYLFIGIALVSSIGLLVVLFIKHPKKQSYYEYSKIFFIVLILYIITSLILTPIWLNDLYAIPILPQIPLRLIKMPVEVLLYTFLLERLLNVYHASTQKEEEPLK